MKRLLLFGSAMVLLPDRIIGPDRPERSALRAPLAGRHVEVGTGLSQVIGIALEACPFAGPPRYGEFLRHRPHGGNDAWVVWIEHAEV